MNDHTVRDDATSPPNQLLAALQADEWQRWGRTWSG